MNLDGRSRKRLGTAGNRLSRWLAVLFPVTAVGTLFGQSYLAPPPGFQGAPAVPATGNVTPATAQNGSQISSQTQEQINNQANGTAESGAQGTPAVNAGSTAPEATAEGPLAMPLNALMRWGAVHVHLRASYQFLYATGIHTAPGDASDTFTHSLTPGVTLDLGPHVTASYSPSIRFYSQKDFHNTVDHSFDLHGGYNIGKWTLGIYQSLAITDQPLVETSSQTKETGYNAGLTASYHPNEKLSLTTTAGVGLHYIGDKNSTNIFVGTSPSGLSDSQSYNAAESLDYQVNDYVSAGALASFGYTDQNGGFKSFDQQYNVHLNWRPGTKLSVGVSGGFEHQDFSDSKASAAWNPVYAANIGYQLFEQTSLSIFANRSVSASIFDKQISETTAIGAGIQQRLLGKVHLSLGFGYTKADYLSTATVNLSTSRSDESTSCTVGLSVPFREHFNFSTFYEFSQNSSSQKGFSYDSSQVGMTVAWSY